MLAVLVLVVRVMSAPTVGRVVLSVFQVGTLTAVGGAAVPWPPTQTAGDALGELPTGSRATSLPQWWLVALCVAGLVSVHRIAALAWPLVGAGVFALLFGLRGLNSGRGIEFVRSPPQAQIYQVTAG